MSDHPHETPGSDDSFEESGIAQAATTDLGRILNWLVARGELDPGGPAYGVALVAVGVGYSGLTKAQKRLYDRDVLPLLLNLPPQALRSDAEAALGGAARALKPNAWQPIREAPHDRPVQLGALVDGEVQPFAFPCRQSQGVWVNAATGRSIFVRPSRWRDWPEV